MFGTLQDVKNYVATAYEVSATLYGAIKIRLQGGVGQGNGANPAIWLIITIPLINMLHDKGFGFCSTVDHTAESYCFVGYTFVNNTDTIHLTTDHQQILSDMQLVTDLGRRPPCDRRHTLSQEALLVPEGIQVDSIAPNMGVLNHPRDPWQFYHYGRLTYWYKIILNAQQNGPRQRNCGPVDCP